LASARPIRDTASTKMAQPPQSTPQFLRQQKGLFAEAAQR